MDFYHQNGVEVAVAMVKNWIQRQRLVNVLIQNYSIEISCTYVLLPRIAGTLRVRACSRQIPCHPTRSGLAVSLVRSSALQCRERPASEEELCTLGKERWSRAGNRHPSQEHSPHQTCQAALAGVRVHTARHEEPDFFRDVGHLRRALADGSGGHALLQ